MIKGKKDGQQPDWNVAVPSVRQLLNKKVFNQQALITITEPDFDAIKTETFRLQFNTNRIPLFGRQPECEQEVLSIVVAAHAKIGIEEIIRVRTRFPDLLVKIGGKKVWLELEVYSQSFVDHGHHKQLAKNGKLKARRGAITKNRQDEDCPVAVLCWVNNRKACEWPKNVQKLDVFELQ